jgi:hypothetical protein
MLKLNKRRWKDLCGEAEVQEEPIKLAKLANQITCILDAEQKRLREPRPKTRGRSRGRKQNVTVSKRP